MAADQVLRNANMSPNRIMPPVKFGLKPLHSDLEESLLQSHDSAREYHGRLCLIGVA